MKGRRHANPVENEPGSGPHTGSRYRRVERRVDSRIDTDSRTDRFADAEHHIDGSGYVEIRRCRLEVV
jgi:hypothetical protein